MASLGGLMDGCRFPGARYRLIWEREKGKRGTHVCVCVGNGVHVEMEQ